MPGRARGPCSFDSSSSNGVGGRRRAVSADTERGRRGDPGADTRATVPHHQGPAFTRQVNVR
jgi:hypothetical protein